MCFHLIGLHIILRPNFSTLYEFNSQNKPFVDKDKINDMDDGKKFIYGVLNFSLKIKF